MINLDRAREAVIESLAQTSQLKNFDVQNAFSLFKILHRGNPAPEGSRRQELASRFETGLDRNMKRYFLIAFFVAAAGLSTAAAQTFTAPVDERRPQTAARRPPPRVYEPVVTGAFPRAARGNPSRC